MTTTTVHVGKARLFNFSITAAGNPDTTTPATIDVSLQGIIRATMNPSNPRQFAVVGLAPGTTNANPHCGAVTLHATVNVPALPPPDGGTVDEAGVGDEVDPSTLPWA